MSDDVGRILSLIPLDSYISRFVSLKQRGRNFLGLCPFHSEKTPSFTVSPAKGIYKCFGCGKGGNLFTFVQEYENIDFRSALKILADQAGVELRHHQTQRYQKIKDEKDELRVVAEWARKIYQNQISDESPQTYLNERKIKPESQKIFSLGFAPTQYNFLEISIQKNFNSKEYDQTLAKLYQLGFVAKNTHNDNNSFNRFYGRLIFPIHDEQGQTIGFGGRLIADKPNAAKYINSTDSKLFHKKNSLYNLHRAKNSIRENNMVILVEGYFDVIGLYQKDIKNVVAPLGTSFTNEQAKLIRRFTYQMVIFFDGDKAGKEAAFKGLLIAQKNKIQAKVVVHFEKLKDPFDISIEKDEIDILTIIDSAKNPINFILWYYFSHKYTITELEEKKNAVSELFSYLKENISQLWEQLEFLKKAASLLEVTYEILEYDFKKFLSGGQTIRLFPDKASIKQRNSPSETEKIPKIEKDILALLLYSPEYWSNRLLIEQISWSTQNMYLIFSYFYDRLKIGSPWEWNKIGETVLDLPKELSSLLSEIVMEFDQVLEDDPDKKDYALFLKKMILQKKVSDIDLQITDLQKRIYVETEGVDTNELILIFQSLLEEKKKTMNAI